jgi:hypothetical protein
MATRLFPCAANVCCGICVPGFTLSIVRTKNCDTGSWWGYVEVGDYWMGTVTAARIKRGTTWTTMSLVTTPTDCLVPEGGCSPEPVPVPYVRANMVAEGSSPDYSTLEITSLMNGQTVVMQYTIVDETTGTPPPYIATGGYCIQDNYARMSTRNIWWRGTASGGVCPAAPAEGSGAVGDYLDRSLLSIGGASHYYTIVPRPDIQPPPNCTGLSPTCTTLALGATNTGASSFSTVILPRYLIGRQISGSASVSASMNGCTVNASITITKAACTSGCSTGAYCWSVTYSASAPCVELGEGAADTNPSEVTLGGSFAMPCSGIVGIAKLTMQYLRSCSRIDNCRVKTTGNLTASIGIRWQKASL